MSILLLFIQLPIIFALYRVFWHSGLPNVNMEMLYDFISRPENIKIMFLGLIDITKKNILLAVIVGATTYLQARFMSPILPKAKEGEKPSFKHDLAKSMHLQMRYVFPVIAAIISYNISAAISLYWSTSNVFTICQELYLRKKLKN
jgi:membrane protein insertase Oxa1/YidC/SpoIIIJ